MYLKLTSIIKEDSKELKELVEQFYSNTLSSEALLFYLDKRFSLSKSDNQKIINIINNQEIKKKDLMQSTEKKISVIIPTHNREKMLTTAIESVLKQNYSNYELIIVDDCSSDSTEHVVKRFQDENEEKKIKYIKNSENLYAGLSRKKGYNNSKGEYIIFLDDDDFYIDNNFFNKVMNIYSENTNLAFVSANTFIYNIGSENIKLSNIAIKASNKKILGKIKGEYYLNNFQTKISKPTSTFSTIFRKKMLDQVDFESMELMDDSSIYVRSLLVGDAYISEDIVGVYNIHSSNISGSLPTDFIIETFDERLWALNNQLSKGKIKNTNDWLYHQINSTLRYFVLNNKIKKHDLNKLLNWTDEKTFNSTKIKLKANMYILYLWKQIQTIFTR